MKKYIYIVIIWFIIITRSMNTGAIPIIPLCEMKFEKSTNQITTTYFFFFNKFSNFSQSVIIHLSYYMLQLIRKKLKIQMHILFARKRTLFLLDRNIVSYSLINFSIYCYPVTKCNMKRKRMLLKYPKIFNSMKNFSPQATDICRPMPPRYVIKTVAGTWYAKK